MENDMNAIHEQANKENRLYDAVKRMQELFGEDYKKVEASAAAHVPPVHVSVQDISVKPEPHSYNQRTPTNVSEAVKTIAKAKRGKLGCMDYRVSDPSLEGKEPFDFWITMAGGADPMHDPERMDALAEFVVASFAVNPDLFMELTVHNGVCGGVKHDTKGLVEEIHTQQGPLVEMKYMTDDLRAFADLLGKKGLDIHDEERLFFGLERIGDDKHKYEETVPVEV